MVDLNGGRMVEKDCMLLIGTLLKLLRRLHER